MTITLSHTHTTDHHNTVRRVVAALIAIAAVAFAVNANIAAQTPSRTQRD